MALNIFLEAKGPDRSAAIVQRQACFVRGHSARGIHGVQNHSKEEATYDSNAYMFSSIYHDGQLKLYAYHMTAPKAPGGRPECHMTQLRTFSMTDTRETFVQGATAFRNARDLEKRYRDTFIQDANARASQSQTVAAQNPARTHNSDPEPVDRTDYLAAQDADDALQQHIADTTHYNCNSEDDDETSVIPHYLFAEDDSQEPSQNSVAPGIDEPSMSFQSSFTSSVTSGSKSLDPHSAPLYF